jgi:hypothetical protein
MYGVLFSHKEEWNFVICRKMNEAGDNHIEQDKPSPKSHVFAQTWHVDLK